MGAVAWIGHHPLHMNYTAKDGYQVKDEAFLPSHSSNPGIPDITTAQFSLAAH